VEKILIIIRRSNGDVLLTSPLINALHGHFPHAAIDLLVNRDTLEIAHLLPHVRTIHTYSYAWRKQGVASFVRKELALIRSILRRYDLAVSLTANDRSTVYAFLAGRTSIGESEGSRRRFWWRRILLSHVHVFRPDRHILFNNLAPLDLLGLSWSRAEVTLRYSEEAGARVSRLLEAQGIGDFLIFHPVARFGFKIYPRELRNALLEDMHGLGIPIIITGGKGSLDRQVSKELPALSHCYNFIGQTTFEEYAALTDLSLGYVGMDTVNMHMAAALGKRVFAIFGPTKPFQWAPWSNRLQTHARKSKPVQTYGDITLFQADMPCVPCGLAGCDDNDGIAQCLHAIDPKAIFGEIKDWLAQVGYDVQEPSFMQSGARE